MSARTRSVRFAAALLAILVASLPMQALAVPPERPPVPITVVPGGFGLQSASVSADTSRLTGATGVDAAVNISKSGWPNASTVVIASVRSHADAIVAGPLAAAYGSPLLLAVSNSLPAATAAELRRLRATRVILVGGTSALSPNVVTGLRALGLSSSAIVRIGGANSSDTARLVAEHMKVKLGRISAVVVVRSDVPWDGLAIWASRRRRESPSSTPAAPRSRPRP